MQNGLRLVVIRVQDRHSGGRAKNRYNLHPTRSAPVPKKRNLCQNLKAN
jgi:hypothetical protein